MRNSTALNVFFKTKQLPFLFLLTVFFSNSQEQNSNVFSITPEFLFGITGESNTNFPDRKTQKQLFINFGWHHTQKTEQWAYYLKNPKTGISLGYSNLGNNTQLGSIFSLLPYIEFNAFKSKDMKLHIGTGLSYITKKHHPITNPNNKASSTNLTWAFRLFMFYNIKKTKLINWRIGTGYAHQSNGHTSLPNQGYNSFLVSLGAEINKSSILKHNIKQQKTRSNYFSIHSGIGINVLSTAFNDKKKVFTLAGEYGRVYNNLLKLGIGTYFRFYQVYYDYISNNESLVQDGRIFSHLKSNAYSNAVNLGITANGELFLNHFGIDLQVGINLYKPAYKIDWRINQGWGDVPRNIPESGGYFRLGDLNESYYKIKRTISARLGLKYYFIGKNKKTSNNYYIGTFINSNLGQADFTELAIGYTKIFNSKNR